MGEFTDSRTGSQPWPWRLLGKRWDEEGLERFERRLIELLSQGEISFPEIAEAARFLEVHVDGGKEASNETI